MLSAASTAAASAAPTPGVDWIALVAAVVSAGLSVWALVSTKRETAARRASNVPSDLRDIVARLLNILRDAEQKAERILQLNEPTHHTAVDKLEEYSPQLADKRLARLVSDFASAVGKCRRPNDPRRDVTLTHTQREKIGQAVTMGKAVNDRLDALARKTER